MTQTFGPAGAGGADGRTKDAAGHGTPLVDIAAARGGVECGTWGIVGEVLESGLIGDGCAERARIGVAGKVRAMLGEPVAGTALDGGGESWLRGAQSGHAGGEARGVEGIDGEGAVAALGATDAAGKECSGAEGRIGEHGVDDLDEFGIARWKRHGGKDTGEGGREAAFARGAGQELTLGAEVSHA